jgi:hypothetical protein
MDTPFIETNCDNIDNMHLAQFSWDLTYWLSVTHHTPDELAIKIGLHYHTSEIEKSNVYLIATLIKRLNGDFPTVIERLGELSKKPSLSGFKFFSEEDENNREFFAGKVQIMTLHKSKGDEFDYVFLPEMAEKNLPLSLEQIKLRASEDFIENVRRLSPAYKPKTEHEIKQGLLAENLRLLYVAITRARKHLYFTVSQKAKSFEKVMAQEPSAVFKSILPLPNVGEGGRSPGEGAYYV